MISATQRGHCVNVQVLSMSSADPRAMFSTGYLKSLHSLLSSLALHDSEGEEYCYLVWVPRTQSVTNACHQILSWIVSIKHFVKLVHTYYTRSSYCTWSPFSPFWVSFRSSLKTRRRKMWGKRCKLLSGVCILPRNRCLQFQRVVSSRGLSSPRK